MRLHELRLIDDDHSTLRLHPRLTIVAGLSPAAHSLVVDGIAGFANGEDHGLVAHLDDGTVIGPAPATAPTTPIAIAVARDVIAGDTILRDAATATSTAPASADVATFVPAPIVIRGHLARPTDLTSALAIGHGPTAASAATTGTARVQAELAAAEASLAAATASLDALQRTVDETRADQRTLVESRRAADAALDEARAAIDPFALVGLTAAYDAAARVEVELGAEPGATRGDTLESARARVTRLERHGDAIARALTTLAHARPGPVLDALDQVRLATATGPVTPPEALRLADEWVVLREHLAALEAKMASEDGGVHSVSDRLDSARARVAACEAAMVPAPVDHRDVQALEAAHEAVLAAERKASSRLGGARARKALEDALTEERAILDRLGFPTWSAWVMGTALLDSTARQTRELEVARRELVAATTAWEAMSEKLEADPEFRNLLDRLERVLHAAHAIVGDAPDVEAALRALVVEPGPPPCPLAEARRALAAALDDAGVPSDAGASADELRVAAEQWLAQVHMLRALRRRLEIDAGDVGDLLDAARDALERIEAFGPVEDGDGFGRDRLLASRHAIEAAEAHLDAHLEAVVAVTARSGESARLAELERQRTVALDAKVELLVVTEQLVDAAAGKVRAIERRRAAASDYSAGAQAGDAQLLIDSLAAQLTHGTGADPHVPVVLDEPVATKDRATLDEVLAWLEDVAAHRQIIYVTDRADVAAWARTRPAESVACSTGSGFFG
jgi:hypothetical protein